VERSRRVEWIAVVLQRPDIPFVSRRRTMRKAVSLLAAGACLALPAVVLADSSDDTTASPAQACKQLRTGMGTTAFKAAYGTNANRSNAFGKCVSKQIRAQQSDRISAAKQCKAEHGDASFAAGHGGKTFAEVYGTNKNGRNAFGRCVSKKAGQTQEDRVDATVNAARTCKAERRSLGSDAFAEKYAASKGRSAFGRCVSTTAKAKQAEQEQEGSQG
jgi:hypothetical protein